MKADGQEKQMHDTLVPYFGKICTQTGPLYPCPCDFGKCDCQDCLDSTNSIIFFNGKHARLYYNFSKLMCQIEDPANFNRFTVVFKNKLGVKHKPVISIIPEKSFK
jgi:hypothetical protein